MVQFEICPSRLARERLHVCMMTERIVVDEAVTDAFVEKFATKAKSLPSGDPRKGNVVLGSLVGPQAADRVNVTCPRVFGPLIS